MHVACTNIYIHPYKQHYKEIKRIVKTYAVFKQINACRSTNLNNGVISDMAQAQLLAQHTFEGARTLQMNFK